MDEVSDPSSSSSSSSSFYFFFASSGSVYDKTFDNITIPFVPLYPFGTPFLPDTHSAASCIARRTASRPFPSSSVTVFALMTAHYRPHRSLWGSSHRVWGKLGAPQGPTSCAPGALLIGQYCLLWGLEPNHDLTQGATKNRQVHTNTTAGNNTIYQGTYSTSHPSLL